MRKQSVAVIEANNTLELAKMRAEAEAIEATSKADAYMLQQKQIADTKATKIRLNAETRLAVAQSRSTALMKEADAESGNSNNMEGMRRH